MVTFVEVLVDQEKEALFVESNGGNLHMFNVTSHHQPGVEAGKKAAELVLDPQRRRVDCFENHPDPMTTAEVVTFILLMPRMTSIM